MQYENEMIGKALNTKYKGAVIDTITANGDVIFKIGGSNSYSRVPAREVSNMVKSFQHSLTPTEDLTQLAKDNVAKERQQQAEAKQAKADDISANSKATRERHNTEGGFGQGYDV